MKAGKQLKKPMCIQCKKKHAIRIGGYFCVQKCGYIYGVTQAQNSKSVWCQKCSEWRTGVQQADSFVNVSLHCDECKEANDE